MPVFAVFHWVKIPEKTFLNLIRDPHPDKEDLVSLEKPSLWMDLEGNLF